MRRLIAERRIAFTKVGGHVRIESDVLDDLIEAGELVLAQRQDKATTAANTSARNGHESGRPTREQSRSHQEHGSASEFARCARLDSNQRPAA
ncbi:MAG TPA: hypothetical protein VHU88_20510 [Sporichthyaceae bacterium]|nr:hypothetical protein [Sporichthyaceae bacterium]